jgi:4-hydroxybenzoate polyprenyltransferase
MLRQKQIYLNAWVREFRVIHWSKNVLVFIPVIAGHSVFDLGKIASAFEAFVLLCFFASSIYILNDIVDVQSDRMHPTKKFRPIASGVIQTTHGLIVAAVLFTFSTIYCSTQIPRILPFFLIYVVTAILYSFFLKQFALVDVLILTFLYTLRIFIGGLATDIKISFWLISFSLLFFLSLAFAKRHAEIAKTVQLGLERNIRRGYNAQDLQTLFALGLCSGFSSVTVFILYINDAETRILYTRPDYLIFLIVILIYWLANTWLELGRKTVSDDPIVNFLTDRKMLVVFPLMCTVLISAL